MEPDLSNSSMEAVSPQFPHGQANKRKPALMQRPKSSGIDVTGFSFARPANQPKGFTLKPMPRLAPHVDASLGEKREVESQKQTTRREKEPSQPKSHVDSGQQCLEQYLAEHTPCPQPKDHPENAPGRPCDNPALLDTEITSMDDPEIANSATGQVIIDLETESDAALITRAIANVEIPVSHTLYQCTKSNGGKTTLSEATASHPPQAWARNTSVAQNPPLPLAQARLKENVRGSKPRRENRKAGLTRQQRSFSSNKSALHQLTEDTLFEMLIGRIRQREENEIAAANIQRQIESQNLELRQENHDLHQQLETGHLQLQKMDTEIKKYQARLEEWKSKIRKFKQVVDELGHEHDVLKDENERFKAIAASLEKDKSDLFQAIDDAKLQIARAEETADEQRKDIAEKEKSIALLQQSLTAAQDQDECTKAELITERNRSATLESYIQNYAIAQAKQIGQIRDDQAKLTQELEKGLSSIVSNVITVRDDILAETKTASEKCHTSIQALNEKFSEEKLEVQEFKDSTQEVLSQIDNLGTKLAEGVETSNRVNLGVSKSIHDSVHSIETHLSADSHLIQQLAECRSSYGWLKGKLETVEPTLNNLSASVEAIMDSEGNLTQQFNDFGKKLEEAQITRGNQDSERRLTELFAENTQLQLKVQKLSSEIDSLKQLGSAKDSKTEELRESLAEARQKYRTAEDRIRGLEMEKTVMKGEMESREQRTRHELVTANANSQDQMKGQYERRLQTLQAEKDELEKGVELATTQLSGVQDALVEAKRLFDDQRAQRESLARETEQRIHQLTQSCSEQRARINAQTLEIQKYQEAEATSCLERNGLQEQLRQAQEKVHELEQTFVVPALAEEGPRVPAANIVPFSALENRPSPSRATSPYGDPADFAMLFMSDELLLPTPHDKAKGDKRSPSIHDRAAQAIQKPLEVADPAKVFDIPRDVDPPPPRATTKRKAVNFAPHRKESTGSQKKEDSNSRIPSTEVQSMTQAENEPEERPAKVTKHINKWTYSRVHASRIEVKQEQSTAPTRATKAVQRASPKGLVSASSASEAAGRSNARGRGKRRSRGDRYSARFSQEG